MRGTPFTLVSLQDMQGSKVLGDEAAGIYERAINGLMKDSMLIYFAYADFEEVTECLLTFSLQINLGFIEIVVFFPMLLFADSLLLIYINFWNVLELISN